MGNTFSNTDVMSRTSNQATEFYSKKKRSDKCARNLEKLQYDLKNNNVSDMLETINTLQNNSGGVVFDTENLLSSIRDTESYVPHKKCGCNKQNNKSNFREILSDSFFDDSEVPPLKFNFRGRDVNKPYVLWN